jgi:hypothetical protein
MTATERIWARNYYVRRTRSDGYEAWTGPIRSSLQAQKEAAAWRSAETHGYTWTAKVEPSTPEIRAKVRKWERAKVYAGYFSEQPYQGEKAGR